MYDFRRTVTLLVLLVVLSACAAQRMAPVDKREEEQACMLEEATYCEETGGDAVVPVAAVPVLLVSGVCGTYGLPAPVGIVCLGLYGVALTGMGITKLVEYTIDLGGEASNPPKSGFITRLELGGKPR